MVCRTDGDTPNTVAVLMTVCKTDGLTPATATVLTAACRMDGATLNPATVPSSATLQLHNSLHSEMNFLCYMQLYSRIPCYTNTYTCLPCYTPLYLRPQIACHKWGSKRMLQYILLLHSIQGIWTCHPGHLFQYCIFLPVAVIFLNLRSDFDSVVHYIQTQVQKESKICLRWAQVSFTSTVHKMVIASSLHE
jgi:hypothetical protein